MPRISAASVIQAPDVSEALEWVVGDAGMLEGISETDTDPSEPQNLTGATFECVTEFYKATIVDGAGRSASIRITNLVRDEDRANRTLNVTVDPNQVSRTGRFEITIPDDWYPAPQPEADLVADVPCAIVYLRMTLGDEKRTERMVVVFRRGVPS